MKVPPFRATGGLVVPVKRVILVPVLSSVSVPPVLTVRPVMALRTPLPLRVSAPPLMVMVLVDELLEARARVPVLFRVTLPAGTGVLDKVSAALPLTPPAKVVVLVANTSGAFDWVTAPLKVIGLPVKATGVPLLL